MSFLDPKRDHRSALQIYLNDHLALVTAEIELANRTAKENKGTELGTFLDGYSKEVDRQRKALEKLIKECGGEVSLLKTTAGWFAEKVGRLKPNTSWTGYTDLARVIELETLITAANARLQCWQTSMQVAADDPTGGDSLYSKEITMEQIESLEHFHQLAVSSAFQRKRNSPNQQSAC